MGYSNNLFESMGMNLLLVFALVIFVLVLGILLFFGRKNLCLRKTAQAIK